MQGSGQILQALQFNLDRFRHEAFRPPARSGHTGVPGTNSQRRAATRAGDRLLDARRLEHWHPRNRRGIPTSFRFRRFDSLSDQKYRGFDKEKEDGETGKGEDGRTSHFAAEDGTRHTLRIQYYTNTLQPGRTQKVEVLLETAHGGSTGSGSSVSLSMGREREDLPVPGAVALRLGDSSPAVPVVREGRLLSATVEVPPDLEGDDSLWILSRGTPCVLSVALSTFLSSDPDTADRNERGDGNDLEDGEAWHQRRFREALHKNRDRRLALASLPVFVSPLGGDLEARRKDSDARALQRLSLVPSQGSLPPSRPSVTQGLSPPLRGSIPTATAGSAAASSRRQTKETDPTHGPSMVVRAVQRDSTNRKSSRRSTSGGWRKMERERGDSVMQGGGPPRSGIGLILVDVQNEMTTPSGALYDYRVDAAMERLNELRDADCFDLVVVSRTAHPLCMSGLCSVPREGDRDRKEVPPHCLAESMGVSLHRQLLHGPADVHVVVGKVQRPVGCGNHSCLLPGEMTGVMDRIRHMRLETIVIAGVGLTLGILQTAADLMRASKSLRILIAEDACAPVSTESPPSSAWRVLRDRLSSKEKERGRRVGFVKTSAVLDADQRGVEGLLELKNGIVSQGSAVPISLVAPLAESVAAEGGSEALLQIEKAHSQLFVDFRSFLLRSGSMAVSGGEGHGRLSSVHQQSAGGVSCRLFVKSDGSDVLTAFVFSLLPSRCEGGEVLPSLCDPLVAPFPSTTPDSLSSLVARVDRFEVPLKGEGGGNGGIVCGTGPAGWFWVDVCYQGASPETRDFDFSGRVEAAEGSLRLCEEGLPLAPGVLLSFESVGGGESGPASSFSRSNGTGKGGEGREFAVSLTVGEFVFVSVCPVSAGVLGFLLDVWARQPSEGVHQLIARGEAQMTKATERKGAMRRARTLESTSKRGTRRSVSPGGIRGKGVNGRGAQGNGAGGSRRQSAELVRQLNKKWSLAGAGEQRKQSGRQPS